MDERQQELREELHWRLTDLMGYVLLLDCLLFARQDEKSPVTYYADATVEHLRRTLCQLIGWSAVELGDLSKLLLK